MPRNYPANTLLNGFDLPTIRATIEIAHNNPAKAIELLQIVEQYDLANVRAMLSTYYTRPRLSRPPQRPRSRRRISKDRRSSRRSAERITGALAKFGLARAYALQGDNAKARVAYQDFFALWKDADPKIPILLQAKSEYAKLQ